MGQESGLRTLSGAPEIETLPQPAAPPTTESAPEEEPAFRGARRTDPLAPVGFGNELAYGFIVGGLKLLLRTVFRVSVADTRPLPEGPVILAPNHRSFVDPAVIGSLMTRRPIFMMHAKYYDMRYLNWVYRLARCIPVESGSENRRALREGKRVLDAGRPLVIFPEGTISPDGNQQLGQAGMAWLARVSGAPVVPFHIGGSREVLRKGSWRVHFHRVTLRQGKPRWRSEFGPGRQGDESFTAAVMSDIAALERAGRGLLRGA